MSIADALEKVRDPRNATKLDLSATLDGELTAQLVREILNFRGRGVNRSPGNDYTKGRASALGLERMHRPS